MILSPLCRHHRRYRRALRRRVCVKGRPPPTCTRFTSGQLAPEQKQTRQWHMWLRGERCGRPPDDEGDEGERRARGLRGCVCGGRAACARSGLPGVVLHHSLVFYGLARQRRLKGEQLPFPRFRPNGKRRSPLSFSRNVKASEPPPCSLPSLRPERLSAELRANWDRCQSHLQPRGTPAFSACLMKRQNNRFAYTETGVVTGLTPVDLGDVKE